MSTTSLIARQCRLREWAQMVQNCRNRPEEMSIDEWCEAHSITKANYYYRMTQVRKACLDAVPKEVVEQSIVPVPMNLMTIDESNVSAKLSESSFLALESNGITIRVTDRTSTELLAKVLGVIAHVNDATCFKQVYIVCGYTDLRSGIDKLTAIIDAKTGNSPYVPDTLYLFCGRKIDRIKGLVWEKDSFLLLYKRLEQGKFVWPRNEPEVQALTPQQFCWLMEGLTTIPKKAVRPVETPEYVA